MTRSSGDPAAGPVGGEPRGAAGSARGRRAIGVDLCKIVGALAVFTYHFVQDYRGETGGAWAIGWLTGMRLETFGTWGVCLFVTVSGLTLGWSYAGRPCGAPFWKARVRRIYPTFWWVAVPLTFLAAAAGTLAPEDYWKAPVWWAGASFVSPATFWPVVDSWWYIGLAMQLYLAFTGFAWLARRRWGVLAVAALCAAAPFVYVLVLPRAGAAAEYLESWFIGLSYVTLFGAGFLLSRLLGGGRGRSTASPDALAGLALLAVALVVMAVLRDRWSAQPAALAFVVLVVPWRLRGADAGGQAGAATRNGVPVRTGAAARAVAWLAGLSFVFYLSHSPWAKPVLEALSRAGIDGPWVSYVACLAAAFAVALGFWASFRWAEGRLAKRRTAR